ncbi:MAG: site-specific integrase [Oscillospiraceae bacterium]|nr:site-specific integrase [Oscillospiraceae bacterium]
MGRPKKESPTHSTGMYVYKKNIGHNFDGTPIRKAFYSSVSKAAAKAKADQYVIDHAIANQLGDGFTSHEECFDSWAHKVLEMLVGTVKDSTYDLTYKNSVENHLIPYFKKAKVSNIKQIDIQKYFNAKGKKFSLETLKKHKLALNKIFEYAVLNEICTKNPVCMIKLSSNIKPVEKNTYTKDQAITVLAYAKNHRYGLDIHLMLCYGLSRSELLGLRLQDIDFENNIMHIVHGLTEVKNSKTEKMELCLDDPKNDFRRRDIPITQETADMLRTVTTEYISHNKDGSPCHPRTWQRRHFDVFMQDMTKDTGVPSLNPHELRHTRASLWVNDGENLFAIAEVLGHADLKMLRKRYAHGDVEATRNMLNLK